MRGGSCVRIPEHSSPIPANAPTRCLSRSLSVASGKAEAVLFEGCGQDMTSRRLGMMPDRRLFIFFTF